MVLAHGRDPGVSDLAGGGCHGGALRMLTLWHGLSAQAIPLRCGSYFVAPYVLICGALQRGRACSSSSTPPPPRSRGAKSLTSPREQQPRMRLTLQDWPQTTDQPAATAVVMEQRLKQFRQVVEVVGAVAEHGRTQGHQQRSRRPSRRFPRGQRMETQKVT